MPETARSSDNHHTHIRSRKSSSIFGFRPGILEPVLYFSGAILMLIFTKLLHLSMLPFLLGAMGVILLAVSKNWRLGPGVVISIFFIILMIMVNVLHWVTSHVSSLLSAEIISKQGEFSRGLIAGIILAILMWTYHRLLHSVQFVVTQKWFVKLYVVTLVKLFFYFQLFLVLFWGMSFMMLKAQTVTRLGIEDSTMVAGALAMLAAGIPAIIYLSKRSSVERHHQHHRHHRSDRTRRSSNPPTEKKPMAH